MMSRVFGWNLESVWVDPECGGVVIALGISNLDSGWQVETEYGSRRGGGVISPGTSGH